MTRMLRQLLAPQQNACHLCGALLARREHTLCEGCQAALNRLQMHPVEAASREHAPMALALSAYWFDGEARTLVHRLKFQHDRLAALPLAHGLCRAYGEHTTLGIQPDGVLAVPVHVSRLAVRGYNQAELLAQAFCEHTGLPLLTGGLTRETHDQSQVRRNRAERLSAMTGAFRATRRFDGLRLLLVDDVLTTGATAVACAECLLGAGAAEVLLLTACRA